MTATDIAPSCVQLVAGAETVRLVLEELYSGTSIGELKTDGSILIARAISSAIRPSLPAQDLATEKE